MSLLLASCGTLGSFGLFSSPEETLRRRAEAYWAAQKDKNWKQVRTFVDPESVDKLETYFRKREESKDLSRILKVDIKGLEVQGDEGRTTTVVSAELSHPLLGEKAYPVEQTVEERWVRRRGEWYVVINPPSLEDVLRKMQQAPRPAGPASGG